MKILAVDHGQKNIGLAISDETGTLARRLAIIPHISKELDASRVADLATQNSVDQVIVGVSYDEEGSPNLAGRRAINFSETLKQIMIQEIVLWDESLTTQDARRIRLDSGVSRKKRAGHLDDVAAAVLLQDYLTYHKENAHEN